MPLSISDCKRGLMMSAPPGAVAVTCDSGCKYTKTRKLDPPAMIEACSVSVLYPEELTSISYSPPWMLGNVAVELSCVGAVRWTPLKLEESFTKALPGK